MLFPFKQLVTLMHFSHYKTLLSILPPQDTGEILVQVVSVINDGNVVFINFYSLEARSTDTVFYIKEF